jgi:Centromere DNA-binding protein complex CBF3 subunit, domain 2
MLTAAIGVKLRYRTSSPLSLKARALHAAYMLIFTTRAGKENQYGRLETIGAMRHKKPLN